MSSGRRSRPSFRLILLTGHLLAPAPRQQGDVLLCQQATQMIKEGLKTGPGGSWISTVPLDRSDHRFSFPHVALVMIDTVSHPGQKNSGCCQPVLKVTRNPGKIDVRSCTSSIKGPLYLSRLRVPDALVLAGAPSSPWVVDGDTSE